MGEGDKKREENMHQTIAYIMVMDFKNPDTPMKFSSVHYQHPFNLSSVYHERKEKWKGVGLKGVGLKEIGD